MLLDIVLGHVVIVFPARGDFVRQVTDGHVRVSLYPAVVGNGPIIPVITAGDGLKVERIGGGDREDIADAGIVGNPECRFLVATEHLELMVTANPVVLPGIDREKEADPAIGVEPDHRHVGIHFTLQVDPGEVAALVGCIGVK